MKALVLRLQPGQDLREEILAWVRRENVVAGAIVTCVGSLSCVVLRPAGHTTGYSGGHSGGLPGSMNDLLKIDEEFEIVSLVGTLSTEGCHLHISVSDPHGVTMGGHLMKGCVVRTTAEIVALPLQGIRFARELDPQTGFKELVIQS